MYICLCKRVTDRAIVDAVHQGAHNLREVSRRLGVAKECGECACAARDVIRGVQQHIAAEQCYGLSMPTPEVA